MSLNLVITIPFSTTALASLTCCLLLPSTKPLPFPLRREASARAKDLKGLTGSRYHGSAVAARGWREGRTVFWLRGAMGLRGVDVGRNEEGCGSRAKATSIPSLAPCGVQLLGIATALMVGEVPVGVPAEDLTLLETILCLDLPLEGDGSSKLFRFHGSDRGVFCTERGVPRIGEDRLAVLGEFDCCDGSLGCGGDFRGCGKSCCNGE